jgi:hypothetical protein
VEITWHSLSQDEVLDKLTALLKKAFYSRSDRAQGKILAPRTPEGKKRTSGIWFGSS